MSPSELIELYIYEVTRRLPEQSRGDIALELRSTIEDMLPEDYGEAEVKEALSQLGDPAALAAQYRDQPAYLIGPRYFDSYVQVMKMVIPIAVVIALLSLIANQIITYSGEVAPVDAAATLLSKAIQTVLGIGVQTVFWITLVFVILERTGTGKELPLNGKFKAWTPDDLKDARYVPKEKVIKKSEVFFNLMWTAIWGCVYFNADRLIGVYENGRFEMTTPVFNQEVLLSYWPFIVLILVLDVALAIYKWVVSQWTVPIAFFNVANHVLSAVVFGVMIRNAELLAPGFVTKMEEIFGPQSLGVSGFNSEWVMWLALFAYLLAAAIDSYQGFRKANISKPVK
ncbi:HAAS signaling domain-containing protein [Paenibacillus rhizolycopersici]|uniref:HAAS signaling domain-containing protein n=1 Tax=Paenibacillus rhizolycopersici TaxID=2780073 RepID=UPI003D2DCE17